MRPSGPVLARVIGLQLELVCQVRSKSDQIIVNKAIKGYSRLQAADVDTAAAEADASQHLQ